MTVLTIPVRDSLEKLIVHCALLFLCRRFDIAISRSKSSSVDVDAVNDNDVAVEDDTTTDVEAVTADVEPTVEVEGGVNIGEAKEDDRSTKLGGKGTVRG